MSLAMVEISLLFLTGIAQPETSGSNGSNNDASGVQTNNNASEGSLGNSVNAGAVSEYQGALSQGTTSNSASSTQEGETSSGSTFRQPEPRF